MLDSHGRSTTCGALSRANGRGDNSGASSTVRYLAVGAGLGVPVLGIEATTSSEDREWCRRDRRFRGDIAGVRASRAGHGRTGGA